MKLAPTIGLLLAVAWSVSCAGELQWTRPSKGMPWPEPMQSNMLDTEYIVDPSALTLKATAATCQDLDSALHRYQDILKGMTLAQGSGSTSELKTATAPTEVELQLSVACPLSGLPSADMDESYNISINAEGMEGRAIISADTIWGMLRGLETFTHLIYLSDEDNMFHLRQGAIHDVPRYSHRGLLLDTSRHFLSVPIIQQNIDLMAFNKLNVLHWHIVDDQSFPYESAAFPNLSAKGAYSQKLVYSQSDVGHLIEYARQRGVRLIPEFDTPGHTLSWGEGQTDILTVCYNSDGTPNGNRGPIDPSLDSTYTFLTSLLTEVTGVFPDTYVHLGGDEVSGGFGCWLSNPGIQAWMKELNITTATEIENEYIKKLLDIVANLGTKPEYVIWQEVIDNNVKVLPDTIVEVWKGGWQEEMAKVTSLGLRTILSTPWYLNYISYGNDWPNYYKVEPESFTGTDAQKKLVIGGEACIWGEYVDDTNCVPRLWPRASAVAERLWSSKDVNDVSSAAPRIVEQRCRMLKRGYPVEPANGPGFC